MDELQVKLTTLSQQNARLVQHATGLEQQRQLLASQVCGGVAGGWGGWGSRRTRGGGHREWFVCGWVPGRDGEAM